VEKLNRWLTLIANLGVVGGLVFVGIEVTQNTNILRASMSAEMTTQWITNTTALANDEGLAEIYYQTLVDPDSLTPQAALRINSWSIASLKSGEFAFHQWQAGNLDDTLWEATHELLESSFQTPTNPWRLGWPRNKRMFTSDYQTYIDALVATADASG